MVDRHSDVPAGARTEVAEHGLGLDPSTYWYVGRVTRIYGRVLMAWELSASSENGTSSSVTPFDTGGIWHGYFDGDPPFASDKDKRDFVNSESVGLVPGIGKFYPWLRSAYSDPRAYVAGSAEPSWHRVPRLMKASADELAWSWEFRMPKAEAPDLAALRLKHVFWTREDFRSFLPYVRQALGDLEDLRFVLERLGSVSKTYRDLDTARAAARTYVQSVLEAA